MWCAASSQPPGSTRTLASSGQASRAALLADSDDPHAELLAMVWGPRFDREHALGLWARLRPDSPRDAAALVEAVRDLIEAADLAQCALAPIKSSPRQPQVNGAFILLPSAITQARSALAAAKAATPQAPPAGEDLVAPDWPGSIEIRWFGPEMLVAVVALAGVFLIGLSLGFGLLRL